MSTKKLSGHDHPQPSSSRKDDFASRLRWQSDSVSQGPSLACLSGRGGQWQLWWWRVFFSLASSARSSAGVGVAQAPPYRSLTTRWQPYARRSFAQSSTTACGSKGGVRPPGVHRHDPSERPQLQRWSQSTRLEFADVRHSILGAGSPYKPSATLMQMTLPSDRATARWCTKPRCGSPPTDK